MVIVAGKALLVVAKPVVAKPEFIPYFRMLRIQRNALLERVDGFSEFFRPLERNASMKQGVFVEGVYFKRFIVKGYRLFSSSEPVQCDPEIYHGFGIRWIQR